MQTQIKNSLNLFLCQSLPSQLSINSILPFNQTKDFGFIFNSFLSPTHHTQTKIKIIQCCLQTIYSKSIHFSTYTTTISLPILYYCLDQRSPCSLTSVILIAATISASPCNSVVPFPKQQSIKHFQSKSNHLILRLKSFQWLSNAFRV